MATPAPQSRIASSRRKLQRQLDRAARVQRSLLPDVRTPVGAFSLASLYWPCDVLGGDFYDLARRRDCGVLLCADVMGHGPEAALITMLVKAAFQEAAAEASEPDALLTNMGVRLHRTLPSGRTYVAALAVRLDLAGAPLRLANAGLPHPFVLRGDGRCLDELSLDGVPLGLMDETRPDAFGTCSLDLGPRDVLLLASDGIGSVRSSGGDYFEDRGLRAALARLVGRSGDAVVDRLGVEARHFGHGRPLPDDVNVIAVWRRSRMPDGLAASAGAAIGEVIH